MTDHAQVEDSQADSQLHFFEFLGHKKYGLTAINFFDDSSGNRERFYKSESEECVRVSKIFDSKGQVYASLNPVRLDIDKKTWHLDEDITAVLNIFIDIDAIKKDSAIFEKDLKKYAATEEEYQESWKAISVVKKWLIEHGFKTGYYDKTGNGIRFILPIPAIELDGTNREEISLKIKAFLDLIRKDTGLKIDAVHDLRRITGVPCTLNKKKETQDRRNRIREPMQPVPARDEDIKLRDFILQLECRKEDASDINEEEAQNADTFREKLNHWLERDAKLRLLYGGEISDYESRSEAELALHQKLLFYGFDDNEIDKILSDAKIGKWATENKSYREHTRKKAHQNQIERMSVSKKESEVILEIASIDDIPLPTLDVIPPISFEGLPDYNLIKMFVDYISTVSDTYQEYSFQNGIASLSTLVRRRLYFRLNGRKEFTNLITASLGQSGYARKGSSMGAAQKMLKDAVGDTFLSPDATPEGLIRDMADIIETTQTTRKGSETVTEYQNKNAIRMALRSLWKDEAGQFYAQLNKSHMQSMKELLCYFYDCPTEYEKTLSSKKFKLYAIYFGMNLATTPTSFIENVTLKDVHTGFLARHNIVNPAYQKTRKDITEDSDTDLQREGDFVKLLKLVDSMLPETALRVRVGDACLKILNTWAKEREEYFAKERNELMGSFFARFQINVLKIALLIELANIPFYVGEYYKNKADNSQHEKTIIIKPQEIISKNPKPLAQTPNYAIYIISLYNNNIISDYKISSISLSINSLLFAIKMYDSIYIPYTHQICVSGRVDVFANYLTTIYKILMDKKKVDYSTLLRNSHVPSMEFNQAISTLIESGAVKEYRVKGKTKPQRVFVYIPHAIERFSFTPAQAIYAIDDSVIELTAHKTTVVPEASDGTGSIEEGETHKLGEKSPSAHAGIDGNNHNPNDGDGGRAKITTDFPDEAQKFKSPASPADRVTQTKLITVMMDAVEIKPQPESLPDESARTVMTPQDFDLACKGWEQSHQQSINSGNLVEATFDLKPQFPGITADDLAAFIRRYAKIPEKTGNNGKHSEQCGIVKETYLGSIQIPGKEVSVVEEL